MRFCLDRVENGIAVCLCESVDAEKKYEFALSDVPALRGIADGTLFEATLDADGKPHGIQFLTEETDSRRAHNRSRLAAMFAKSKKGL